MKIRRVHVGWLVAAVGVALALYLVLRPNPIPVEAATVDRGPLRVTVDEEGETRVVDRFVVSAPITGRLVRLEKEVGDPVGQGEVVGHIYAVPLDPRARTEAATRVEAAAAAHGSAVARVAQAEALAGEARRTYERLARVAEEDPGAVALQRLDEARTEAESVALDLAQARGAERVALHDVRTAQAALLSADGDPRAPSATLRSPAGGRVLRRYEENDRVVAAGSPIVEIGNPEALEVVVDVLSDDATRLRKGASALITQNTGGDTIHGWIRRVEPSGFTKVSPLGVEEQRVNVIVALEGGTRLGDRYRVSAALTAWESDGVLRVPVSALFPIGDDWGVYVIDRGRARRREIRIGERGRQLAEVLAGLDEGDRVILYPPESLRDGARVTVEEGSTPP